MRSTDEDKRHRWDGSLRFLLVHRYQGSRWMKNDGKLFFNVSISGLTLGGVSIGKGRILKDNGAQSPSRAGISHWQPILLILLVEPLCSVYLFIRLLFLFSIFIGRRFHNYNYFLNICQLRVWPCARHSEFRGKRHGLWPQGAHRVVGKRKINNYSVMLSALIVLSQ